MKMLYCEIVKIYFGLLKFPDATKNVETTVVALRW